MERKLEFMEYWHIMITIGISSLQTEVREDLNF